jgi:hypothetical protein
MKRALFVAFCILALCSLLVIATGTVKAFQTGYEVTDYVAITTPTMDGNWTASDEWTDAEEKQLEGDLNATFRLKYVSDPDLAWVNQYYLIEFFDDTTDDAGDYWQICYAVATEFYGDPTGGTTPQTDCLKFEYVGHAVSGLAVYQGDGAGWVAYSTYTIPDDVEIVDSFGTTFKSDTPHWTVEIKIEHNSFAILPNFWIYVAVHDESDSSAVQSWPPGSSDVPDDWGFMNASQSTIPEVLTIGAIVLLSSVAVVVSFYCLRKRPKTERYSSGKTREINYTR